MPLLDTNVLSAVMRPTPAAVVLAWLDDQEAVTRAFAGMAGGNCRNSVPTSRSGRM